MDSVLKLIADIKEVQSVLKLFEEKTELACSLCLQIYNVKGSINQEEEKVDPNRNNSKISSIETVVSFTPKIAIRKIFFEQD